MSLHSYQAQRPQGMADNTSYVMADTLVLLEILKFPCLQKGH